MINRRVSLKRLLEDPVLRRRLIRRPLQKESETEKVPDNHWTRGRLLSHPEGKRDPLAGS
jgi:hypothetical protein